MAVNKRPLMQGNVFSSTGNPDPRVDPSGMSHIPQESQGFGVPEGPPKPCGQLLIEASRWTREYFDRPSLIVPDTDDPVMHVYCYECNSFSNYGWTAYQTYKAKDMRRGGLIYIHRPGWYTLQNVGTTTGAIDIKCRVYDEASLWNWTAEMQQITGYDPLEVAWRTIMASKESPGALAVSDRGGCPLYPSDISGYTMAVPATSGGVEIVASGANVKWASIQNQGEPIMVNFGAATQAYTSGGYYMASSGAGFMQIDGSTPWRGQIFAISPTGSGKVFVTVGV